MRLILAILVCVAVAGCHRDPIPPDASAPVIKTFQAAALGAGVFVNPTDKEPESVLPTGTEVRVLEVPDLVGRQLLHDADRPGLPGLALRTGDPVLGSP